MLLRSGFRDVDAKLDRADVHLQSIRSAIATEATSTPDRIPGDFDGESGRFLFRAARDSRSGPGLSPFIGDCIHNLRSALDFAVWELVS